jgi:GR25 family glycosyltransferase involved in LPS biosynthesis
MKAFVIALRNSDYSKTVAERCIQSAKVHGVEVDWFWGVQKEQAEETMVSYGLRWGWANDNTSNAICPVTGLHQFPYTTKDIRTKIGCSMSHFKLWERCVNLDQPILILEHDAVFLRPLPEIEFQGICQINDPNGATRRGSWWSKQMVKRNKEGVFEKTWVTTPEERHIPDGLAGNSAYLIKPHAAKELIDKYYKLGVWPNDATMCKQLFPYLEEYYPFVTKVVQTKSTTIG